MLKVMAAMAGDVLHNLCTGYYEEGRPTSKERTAERKKNCLLCIQRVLEVAVGPGDLLSSDIRADIAAEAYAAWGDCQGCLMAKSQGLPAKGIDFAKYNLEEISHDFVTTGPFRDLVHAIVNRQQKLDEAFFKTVVERMRQHFGEGDKMLGEEDFQAMAVELATLSALCTGVRAFCAAAGYEAPQLPARPTPAEPGRFRCVADYSTGSFKTDRSIAWGPTLPTSQLRKEVTDRFGINRSLWLFSGDLPMGPTSKASAAPLTCWELLKYMDVMYAPVQDIPRFMKVPGEDRTLNRGQLEVAAADYTTGKACSF
eukprot:s2735_g8.t1